VDVADVPGWIGIYVQKNALGVNMAFASAVLLILRKCDPEYRGWATLSAVLVIVLLLLSDSMSSIIMFVALLAMFPLCRGLRKSAKTIGIACLVFIPASAYAAMWTFDNLETVTKLIGKDPTLTGRIQLWILSVVMALQRPWLGYGYSAFWRGLEGPSAAIWRAMKWPAPHSHNGWLEVWLGLGIVGVIMFLVLFVLYVKRAIQYVRAVPSIAGRWPLFFIVLFFLSNLTGANILARNTIFWIVFVAVGVVAARAKEAHVIETGLRAA
jgi:exopolysaccharide production protein ExoQ